ncbi:hypothetical protein [Ruminococcus difficilis]|uniref:Uncharacterized protein n=1 Tax=Ruminococcus difficilis TaxID=2763069 RepID=A0A934WS33_9FIRM|nr:hypothetical protein [Ruminococcus difficilis]MBK6088897.1 hypothetical protein [Ruminococcus difficilis]
MDIKNNIKCGLEFVSDTVSEIASSVAEKNRLRVQLNHIKGLIKSDSATRDQAYIELGRYFYDNLREGTTAENEAICAVIDAASDRISKASIKYVELLNIQNDTKIRSENAEKLAKAMAEKASVAAQAAKEKGAEAFDKAKATAADLSEKAKATAAEFKDKAADTVDNVRERFNLERNGEVEELIAAEQEKLDEAKDAAEEAVEEAAETVAEKAEDVVEEVKEAVIPENTDEESPEDIGF